MQSMIIDSGIVRILDKAKEGRAPGKDDCIHMLKFSEISPEAALIRATADSLMRQRYGNEALVFAQIGVEITPCPGKCKFCAFAEGYTSFGTFYMTDEEILSTALNFTESQEIYALFLMTMHKFDFERLLRIIRMLRGRIHTETQLCVNIGDFDDAQAKDLKAEGVSGAYHLARLREGIDTSLDPETRKATIRAIKATGMDWFYCCEPIGPEHSPEELVEELFLGREYGCYQHGAMSRVFIPSSPLARYGQISELRLGQITAVVSLAMLETPETKTIGVHEPNLIGLTSGANTIYAETGSNPRDIEKETSGHRGRDIAACKRMLSNTGFSRLLTSPGKHKGLDTMY
jgi:biotin synthase